MASLQEELAEVIKQRNAHNDALRAARLQQADEYKVVTELNERRAELEGQIAREWVNNNPDAWPKRFSKTVHGSDEDETLTYFGSRVCGFKRGTDAMWQIENCAYEVTLSFEVDQDGNTKLIGASRGSDDTIGIDYVMPSSIVLQIDDDSE